MALRWPTHETFNKTDSGSDTHKKAVLISYEVGGEAKSIKMGGKLQAEARGMSAPAQRNLAVRILSFGRQGSQVSMRVARGSASWLSSHGRGLGPRDALKKDS